MIALVIDGDENRARISPGLVASEMDSIPLDRSNRIYTQQSVSLKLDVFGLTKMLIASTESAKSELCRCP